MLRNDFIIISFLTLLSIFISRVFQHRLLFVFYICILSLLLVWTLVSKSKFTKVLIIVFSLILAALLLWNNFDHSLFSTSPQETHQNTRRHSYYAEELGPIYSNKYGVFYFSKVSPVMNKLSQKLGMLVDANAYFSNYNLFQLPFLVIGFLYLMIKRYLTILLYLVVVLGISILVIPKDNINLVMMLPFVITCTTVGLFKLLKWRKS